MTNEEKNNALYEKVSAEQDKYRSWLLSQPPEEILNHTYEYNIREDIVMAMEDMELIGLTEEQTDALLKSESPLAYIYRDFTKVETNHMDVVRGCIEDRAKAEVKQEQEIRDALRKLPVYPYPAEHARECGELEQYRASQQANIACRNAIADAIDEHRFDHEFDAKTAVRQVADQFGYDRLLHVCANTIQHKERDGRISSDNIRWAQTMTIYEDVTKLGTDHRLAYLIPNHPVLTDAFVRAARHEYLLTQPLTPGEVKHEALNILAQYQDAKGPNSADKAHFSARVTPLFAERAHGKAPELLGKFLPFASLAFTKTDDPRGLRAVISQDEDRFKKLRPVRASVLAKLQKPPAITSPKYSAKLRRQER